MSETAVPVTTVSGPLGAGKTTLVNHLLKHPGGRRIAVVVNDMGEVNVDAGLLESSADDGIVDLSNGCICCRLQDDLATTVRRLVDRRDVDTIVVEASGISEPIPVAQTLTGAEGAPIEGVRLDTMVTVVDAYGFWKAFDPTVSLPDRATPQRPLTELMVDQIEFCDVLVLNKCDLVPDEALARIEAELEQLQPRATIHRTVESTIDPETILDTGRFDFEAARRQQGWKQALAHDHDHAAADKHGVESFVYRATAPFDAAAFNAWLADWDGSIVRAKGFAWVDSRPGTVLGVSQAGPTVRAGPIGEWGSEDPATRLVFIGRDLDEQAITATLDAMHTTPATTPTPQTDPFPRE